VLRVVAPDPVPLRPEALDEGLARPALERQSALLDALHCRVAVNEGFFGVAD